ncbi:unnamed protein product [Auanema sp. JU1783]|nr:unnamed protein product [Auanema sp. JU1783]
MFNNVGRLLVSEATCTSQIRLLGRRAPKQGKPPILPPSKKVLYHVVHVPWQKPQDVQELLWRRLVYNNAVTSLRKVFQAEMQQKENAGMGLDAMREAEENELNDLIKQNEENNRKKADLRKLREQSEWKETQAMILNEIEETLQKQAEAKESAAKEVRAAIERSHSFVTKDNLLESITNALENPVVYDFAINKIGDKFFDPTPVKYQEGTPTRQKGRLYDRTLGGPQNIYAPKGDVSENQNSPSS